MSHIRDIHQHAAGKEMFWLTAAFPFYQTALALASIAGAAAIPGSARRLRLVKGECLHLYTFG